MSSIHVITGDSIIPPAGDLSFKIDFESTHGSPARIFEIASDLIRAFEDLDRALLESVDSRIETEFVLEDVQKSSLLVVLRNLLRKVDDDALKDLDWKKQVGAYLVKGKGAAIEWLDRKIEADEDAGIRDLSEQLRLLAEETDVRHLPDYPSIKPSRLAQSLDGIQRAKAKLKDDEALIVDLGAGEYRVNIRSTWLPSEHMPPDTPQELENTMDMVLIVRRPDFLGKAQWIFNHGNQRIPAPIRDSAWMERFRRHEEIIRPGDALRVRARYESTYDEAGALKEQKVEVLKVYGVIRAAEGSTLDMFDEPD